MERFVGMPRLLCSCRWDWGWRAVGCAGWPPRLMAAREGSEWSRWDVGSRAAKKGDASRIRRPARWQRPMSVTTCSADVLRERTGPRGRWVHAERGLGTSPAAGSLESPMTWSSPRSRSWPSIGLDQLVAAELRAGWVAFDEVYGRSEQLGQEDRPGRAGVCGDHPVRLPGQAPLRHDDPGRSGCRRSGVRAPSDAGTGPRDPAPATGR